MSNLREQFNKTTTFITRFTSAGVPILTATGKIYIYRNSDKQYLVGGSWQVVRATSTMIKISDTNQPGQWRFEFDNTVDSALSIDQYVIEMVDDSGNSDNPINLLEMYVGGYIDPIVADIKRLLGLEHDNFVTEATAISLNGKMTQGDVYIYDSAVNATADIRTTPGGLIYQYHIEAPLTVSGNFDKFTQTRVL